MEEGNIGMEGKKERRGRKKKDITSEDKIKLDEQSKFFVDLGQNQEDLKKIKELLREANNKTLGRTILFKDLAIFAIKKLSSKDLEKLRESSLSDMEKIQRLLIEHNKKAGTQMELGEFLIKKLNIE